MGGWAFGWGPDRALWVAIGAPLLVAIVGNFLETEVEGFVDTGEDKNIKFFHQAMIIRCYQNQVWTMRDSSGR